MNEHKIWKLDSFDWLQDNDKKRFFLYDSEKNAIHDNQDRLEISIGAKWHAKGESGCGGYFPKEFLHCPFCGHALLIANATTHEWIPPFGNDNGLRLSPKTFTISSIPLIKEGHRKFINQESENFNLPSTYGNYHFLVSTFNTDAAILLAFDRNRWSLAYWSLVEEQWMPLNEAGLNRIAASGLPEWGWSGTFAQGIPGFAVPSDEGPVWFSLNWEQGNYSTVTGNGKCIGGAGRCNNLVAIPSRAEKAIVINTFDFSTMAWVQRCTLSEPDGSVSLEDSWFSVPVVDGHRQEIYWIGLRGILTYSLRENASLWRLWETDEHPCRAIPELGPPYRDQLGDFWQLCYDTHPEQYKYYKVNGDESDCINSRWAMFCSGLSCCSRMFEHWSAPWDEIDERLQEKAKEFRVPLLCLNQESKETVVVSFENKDSFSPLKVTEDGKKIYNVRLFLDYQHDIPVEFKTKSAFNIASPWELRLFIYDNSLFSYSAGSQSCIRWRLS